MARPHIEFIQAQFLPWQADGPGEVRQGVSVKYLSRDAATGSFTAILRYPPGWRLPSETLAIDEELFVLDGTLEHGNVILTEDCYAFWPRGMNRQPLFTPTGADVLTFIEGGNIRPAQNLKYDASKYVERIDVREGEWTADIDAMGLTGMASSARIRKLRSHPDRGEITYITAAIPYWRESQPERHPVAQELFILSGDVAGNTGIMRAGAYTWRPENVTHGPYGSTTGAVMLFRSIGGGFRTELDPPTDFTFNPSHQPVLPPELERLRHEELQTNARY
jgi:Domain of unknown function (DUF4437)